MTITPVRLFVCAVLIACAGCSQKVSPSYDFPPGTVTSYQFQIAQHHSFTGADGLAKENSLRFGGLLDLASKSDGSAAATGLTGTFRNLRVELDTKAPPSQVATAGATIGFLMDTRGEMRNFAINGNVSMQQKLFFDSVQQTLQEVLPVMPADGLKPGKTWTRNFTASHDAPPMGTLYTHTKITCTARKIRKVGPAQILDISVSYVYRLGDAGGNAIATVTPGSGNIAMYGDGDGDGTIWFDLTDHRMDSADITTRITSHMAVQRTDSQQEMQQKTTSRVLFRAGERPELKPPAMPVE